MQIAEQMADYLTTGAVRNALNMPSITAEEAPRLTPFVRLAEQLGSFAGQLTESGVRRDQAGIRRRGRGHEHPRADGGGARRLPAAAAADGEHGLRARPSPRSAASRWRRRGAGRHGAYESYIRLTVVTERQERSVAGTVFSDGKPRIIQIKGINMEAELGPHMLYVTNRDKPGFIGRLGTLLGRSAGTTSRPSISAARKPAATPSRWWRSTATCRTRRCPRSWRSRAWCRRATWSSEGRRAGLVAPHRQFALPAS